MFWNAEREIVVADLPSLKKFISHPQKELLLCGGENVNYNFRLWRWVVCAENDNLEMSRKVQSENPLKLSGAGKRFIQNEVERSGTEF